MMKMELSPDRSVNSDRAQRESGMRVLVIASVQAEKDAALRGLKDDDRFHVVAGGVGAAAAAASTASALAAADYSLVVNIGICGGFAGRAEIGTIVVADEIVAADLGAETPEGFCSLDELGFGSARIPVDAAMADRAAEALRMAGVPAEVGPVLTVSTATGTAATAAALAARVPGAAAEAMEGFGVATASRHRGVPVLEIRAVSNAVGPRDRAAWRIKEALDALEKACSVLLEVFK